MSFICAQGNKTIHYQVMRSLNQLFVFGNNDDMKLFKIFFNGHKDVIEIVASYQMDKYPNAYLYFFEDPHFRLNFIASGPNCSFFSHGSERYIFGSYEYAKQYKEVRSYISNPILSCSRTHTVIYDGEPEDEIPFYIEEFNETGISDVFRLSDLYTYGYEYDGEVEWSVFAGINCTFIIDSYGKIYQKMLADRLRTGRNGPSLPDKFKNIKQGDPKPTKIVSGDNHVMVLYDDGSFQGFGDNSQGQIPDYYKHPLFKRNNTFLIKVNDIACGKKHTLFLLSNGSVVGFGNSDFGENNSWIVSQSELRATKISCGDQHSLVLLDEPDEVIGWGRNLESQLSSKQPNLFENIQLIKKGSAFYKVWQYAIYFSNDRIRSLQSSKGGSKKKSQNKKKISKKT